MNSEIKNGAAGAALALECTDLCKAFGPVVAVDGVSLAVASGEILALLGPSGCGKTTALRLIAGFERPDAGTVRIGGREVVGRTSLVPPERRHVGMVFQDYALFPHLTVAGNVRYGLQEQGEPSGGGGSRRRGWARRQWRNRPVLGMGRETAERVREALELVALTHLADRHPHELSGGEGQRVALARALAPRPALILLDEPFSNLDTRLRTSVRQEVRDILKRAGAAAVFVTHDQEEAFSLADRVAVMWEGRIAQVGTPQEIYQRPTSRGVAEFVGDADFLPGRAEADGIHTELGVIAVAGSSQLSGAVDVMLRPETLRVSSATDRDGDTAEVIDREYYGHDQVITIRLSSGQMIHVRLGPHDRYRPGERVQVQTPVAAMIFPRK
ncbi:MAG: ABC transporter ATP-binding protein [Dehalococcoidia bacterium]